MHRAIHPGLPGKHANLLQAVNFNGQSQKEYAEQHNIGYSILKSCVQKSRHELRKHFEQCCSLQLDSAGNAIGCGDDHKGSDKC